MSRKKTVGKNQQESPEASLDELDAILAEVQSMEQQATGQPSALGKPSNAAPEDLPDEWNDPDLDALSQEISSAMDDDPVLQDIDTTDDQAFDGAEDAMELEADKELDQSTEPDVAIDESMTADPALNTEDRSDELAAEEAEVSDDVDTPENMFEEIDDAVQATASLTSEVNQLQEELLPDAHADLDALLQSEPEEPPEEVISVPDGPTGEDTIDPASFLTPASMASDTEHTVPAAPSVTAPDDASTPSAETRASTIPSLDAPDAVADAFDQIRRNLESAMSQLRGVLDQVGRIQQETVSRVQQATRFKAAAETALDTGRRFSRAHVDASRARSIYEDAHRQAESLRQAWEDAQRAATEAAELLT